MCWTFALSGGTSALLTILGAFNIVTCTAFARNLMIYHTALADYFMQATYPYRLWAQIILPLLSPVFFCVQLGAWCYLSAADEQIGPEEEPPAMPDHQGRRDDDTDKTERNGAKQTERK